jgi:ribosomal protein S18 acetylase RimI-like enzyme
VIEYRTFANRDPARIAALWNGTPLGRGAASGIAVDALETLNFAQPYFDRKGVILAFDGSELVGFTHAGFGPNADESALSYEAGVICAVIVHPNYRRQGVGRELVRRAEAYLRERGAKKIQAGSSAPLDPFFFGLYGGSRPSGFLESDPDAAPFLNAMGYQAVERYGVYQCDLTTQKAPMSFRFVNVRRKMELTVSPDPPKITWWWETRYGRLDTVQFSLHSKENPAEVAELTVVGLDLYLTAWQQRAVGLAELRTVTTELRKGYAQALLVETCRRLKDELVTLAEAHAIESNTPIIKLLESCGFNRVDTGVVYVKAES